MYNYYFITYQTNQKRICNVVTKDYPIDWLCSYRKRFSEDDPVIIFYRSFLQTAENFKEIENVIN